MYTIEEFKLIELDVKRALNESENPVITKAIDFTIGDEPVFNFTMSTQAELDIVNQDIKKRIPSFDLKRMPYSPYFFLVPGIQRD